MMLLIRRGKTRSILFALSEQKVMNVKPNEKLKQFLQVKKKIDKKWGLITSTHRHRRSFRRMANICILIDSVSSLLLLSLHVFQDH